MGRKPKPDKLTNVERVRRYRQKTPLVRLEIIGLPEEVREQFKNLSGLENAKSSEKLAALIRHWEAAPPQLSEQAVSSAPYEAWVETPIPDPSELLGRAPQAAPPPKLLQSFLKRLYARRKYPAPDRRSAQVQYWRKPYRDHASFQAALNQLGQTTHPEIVRLILDNQLALLVADVLALQEEPLEDQLKTLIELLQGLSMEETDLYRSKTFRQNRKKWLFQGD